MNATATVRAAGMSTSWRSVNDRRPVRHRLSLVSKASSSDNTASAFGVSQRILITGSTRGLGFELARSFLARGDKVFVTSRDAAKVSDAVATLRETFGNDSVAGLEADVSKAASVEAMANPDEMLDGSVRLDAVGGGEVVVAAHLVDVVAHQLGHAVGDRRVEELVELGDVRGAVAGRRRRVRRRGGGADGGDRAQGESRAAGQGGSGVLASSRGGQPRRTAASPVLTLPRRMP